MHDDSNAIVKEFARKFIANKLKVYKRNRGKRLKLNADQFENYLLDAMEAAAREGLIEEHMKLISGIEIVEDREFFLSLVEISKNI